MKTSLLRPLATVSKSLKDKNRRSNSRDAHGAGQKHSSGPFLSCFRLRLRKLQVFGQNATPPNTRGCHRKGIPLRGGRRTRGSAAATLLGPAPFSNGRFGNGYITLKTNLAAPVSVSGHSVCARGRYKLKCKYLGEPSLQCVDVCVSTHDYCTVKQTNKQTNKKSFIGCSSSHASTGTAHAVSSAPAPA